MPPSITLPLARSLLYPCPRDLASPLLSQSLTPPSHYLLLFFFIFLLATAPSLCHYSSTLCRCPSLFSSESLLPHLSLPCSLPLNELIRLISGTLLPKPVPTGPAAARCWWLVVAVGVSLFLENNGKRRSRALEREGRLKVIHYSAFMGISECVSQLNHFIWLLYLFCCH